MSGIQTEVLSRGKARVDMVGQRLPDHLTTVDECISDGLAKRLVRYGLERLDDAGFRVMVNGWSTLVYTCDAEDSPADRSYCVRWKNEQGGYIELIGILTRKGWPSLDHGYEIGHE